MSPNTSDNAVLAYETQGSGPPLVLLHGLTFDRTSWHPVIERLGGRFRTVALDLPGHGQSPGGPMTMDHLTDVVHRTLRTLDVDRPIVVGHSMFGALALTYAAAHPVRGAVIVDNSLDIRPFARLVRQLEPALRSEAFEETFQRVFQASMGLDLLAPEVRAQLLAGQRIRQDLVLGYWTELLQTDPEALQDRIDRRLGTIRMPLLAVFGGEIPVSERLRLDRLLTAGVEEWVGGGHFVHLVHLDRFVTCLLAFAARCESAAPATRTFA
jgi:pimeloyl-ACP methyl ester carboxylesterase